MSGVWPRTPPPKTRILPTDVNGPSSAESPMLPPVSLGAPGATVAIRDRPASRRSFEHVEVVGGRQDGRRVDVIAGQDGDEVHYHRAVHRLGDALGATPGGDAFVAGHRADDGAEDHALDLASIEVERGSLGPERAQEGAGVHPHQVPRYHVAHGPATGRTGEVV